MYLFCKEVLQFIYDKAFGSIGHSVVTKDSNAANILGIKRRPLKMRNRGFHRPSVLFSEAADPWAVSLYKYNRVLCTPIKKLHNGLEIVEPSQKTIIRPTSGKSNVFSKVSRLENCYSPIGF